MSTVVEPVTGGSVIEAILSMVRDGQGSLRFEKVEHELRTRWTRGEIRNAIWKLAHDGHIVISSDYKLAERSSG